MNPLPTEDLKLLSAVVETGSMQAASSVIHLSQPAISRRLQQLEKRVGVRLFQRTGRRMQLTEAGTEFLRRATDILDRLHDLETEMQAFGRGQRGVLRIGATVTVCLYLLPPVLEAMREQFPQYELFLVNETSRQMPELVREGIVDVGVASVAGPLPGLHVHRWQELHLGLLQRQSTAACVGIRVLDDAPLVISSPGSLRAAVDRALGQYGVHPRVAAEADSLEVVRTLVQRGFGAAIVPLEVMREDAERYGMGLCAFEEQIEPLQVACFYRRMSPPLRGFLGLMEAGS